VLVYATVATSAVDLAIAQTHISESTARVSVCFTPGGHCASFIADAIERAQREVRVQAYGFSSKPILDALVAARARGVDVAVILDRFSVAYSGAGAVSAAGIPIWVDRSQSIAHNKIVVIDGTICITGSMNFSRSADKNNVENVVMIESEEVAKWYLDNWQARQTLSKPFEK
jgi:phospholipase D